MHLHVELFCWCSQHPPFGAESALGCSRQDQVSRDGWIKRYLKNRNMRCDVIIWKPEIENWMKLAGYPVYFENELIDYGRFPSVAFRVEKTMVRIFGTATRNVGVLFPISLPRCKQWPHGGVILWFRRQWSDVTIFWSMKCLTNEVWRFTLSAKVLQYLCFIVKDRHSDMIDVIF